MYTPVDILDYVLQNELDSSFMSSLLLHKNNFTIAEIPDRKYLDKGDHIRLKSQSYDLNMRVDDPEIVAAIKCGKYVTSFIARNINSYQVHFLVHKCSAEKKSDNEDIIAREVIQYMILKTIIALRLDSFEKVDAYCKY